MEALSRIGSRIGVPVSSDKVTNDRSNPSFARLLVEVDTRKGKVETVAVVLPNGRQIEVEVVYESEPVVCSTCKRFGHATESCRTTMEKEMTVIVQKQVVEGRNRVMGNYRKVVQRRQVMDGRTKALENDMQERSRNEEAGKQKVVAKVAVNSISSGRFEVLQNEVETEEDWAIVGKNDGKEREMELDEVMAEQEVGDSQSAEGDQGQKGTESGQGTGEHKASEEEWGQKETEGNQGIEDIRTSEARGVLRYGDLKASEGKGGQGVGDARTSEDEDSRSDADKDNDILIALPPHQKSPNQDQPKSSEHRGEDDIAKASPNDDIAKADAPTMRGRTKGRKGPKGGAIC